MTLNFCALMRGRHDIHNSTLAQIQDNVRGSYRVRIFQILLNLRIAEDGVAFTNPPEHPLKGLDLHSLNEPRNETARERRERSQTAEHICTPIV